jgi:hypothetical protein
MKSQKSENRWSTLPVARGAGHMARGAGAWRARLGFADFVEKYVLKNI